MEDYIMHITITGNLGSGKSTICKILQDQYGFEIYSTGKVQRELARELNISTLEMNRLMCSDRKYDTMIDDATARISRENRDKNIIFDSRLAWHFVEQSFKVFLSVSLDVAAERIKNDDRGKEEKYASVEEAKELLAARADTEDKRYKEIYNLDYFNFANYNLVIDSTCCTPEKIASILMKEAENFEAIMKDNKTFGTGNQGVNRILISPVRLYSELISEEDKTRLSEMTKNNKNKDIIGNHILVNKAGEIYTILEGKDEVMAAILSNTPFVLINIK
jgi:cytidylate kinase